MSKMSTLFSATLPIKLLLGVALLACVAAVPFGAADRGAAESARTLAFAGRLLEVGKERWAVEGEAQLAVSELPAAGSLTSAEVAALAMQQSQGGGMEPATMGGATTCPVNHTSCPQQTTTCPTVNTHCPSHSTVCVTTQCPAVATACPEQLTTCQVTTCPAVTTSCPTLATTCPNVRTMCPTRATHCPVVSTTCPLTYTVCNVQATHCPKDPTVCEHTVCPVDASVCPIRSTQCELTICSVDAESSCHMHPVCATCGLSYQQGPPVGFVEPSRLTGPVAVRGETTAVLAPRLAFLP